MAIQLRRLVFFGEQPGPRLLITGGVHGDEFEPIAAIRRLARLFREQSPQLSGFRGRLTLVPIVNEAAFLRGHRCAEDGLDLARVCPGKPDGCITEQTAWALSELIRDSDYYIDLHTGGTELSVSPLAGYTLHPERSILDVQRRMSRAFNLPIAWGTAANLQGRSLSVARDANVPAIYCEYLGSAVCHAEGVEAYVDGCLNVMGELGLLDRRRPSDRVRHVVEDPTPGSGHLQIHNPSPATGFFTPAVTVGDSIRAGERLGEVCDLEGNVTPVFAEQSGLVLVLRTFPRVREGESVGVVLELDGSFDDTPHGQG